MFSNRDQRFQVDGKSYIYSGQACAQQGCNLPNGYGTSIFLDDSLETYKGYWFDGKYDGLGIVKFKDGGHYKGKWSNGQYSGIGVSCRNANSCITAIFNNNGPIEGTWTESNFEYTGRFKDYQPHGFGVYKYSDGTEYTGQHENGFPIGVHDVQYANGSKGKAKAQRETSGNDWNWINCYEFSANSGGGGFNSGFGNSQLGSTTC